ASQALDTIRRPWLGLERFQPDDLLTDAEDVAEVQRPRHVGSQLEVNTVQRPLVAYDQLPACTIQAGVPRRQVAVTREDAAHVSSEHDLGVARDVEPAGFA